MRDETARSAQRNRTIEKIGEPIAIIGMASRFPGSNDLAGFWRMLESGGNAVSQGIPGSGTGRIGTVFTEAETEFPACRFGAFISDIDLFDAEFFRIAPVEAQWMDPQQRLLLETSWQALEDAGTDPARLKGTRTGVYMGIGSNDFQDLIKKDGAIDNLAASLYSVTGSRFSTAIGRVSFALGLEGPAFAVDTACSSSLVAIHQAVSGLLRREADVALAGGVNALLEPTSTRAFASAGMLSPTGQCWTFDAAADGFVRSEGCGVLVLKRLSDAEAAGDRVWAVIRGSAINQDGDRPGLSVPKASTQERVIQDALDSAGLSPADVDYLEAHGTGTKVGDPIEVRAAAAAYGRERRDDRPLLIGSVKTNIGHAAAAAGAAGLLKVVLAMRRGVIPRHLHFRNPNPQIDWANLPVQVTSSPMTWPANGDRLPIAGINSFGFSGTNAHVLVEAYEPAVQDPVEYGEKHFPTSPARRIMVTVPALTGGPAAQGCRPRQARFLPLSGRTDNAVRELAARYLAWLDARPEDLAAGGDDAQCALADMAWTASVGRSHFMHRAGVVFQNAASLRQKLQAIVDSEALPTPRTMRTTAFLYTGQGSHWPGMGEDLYGSEPVARAVLDRCERVFEAERGASLLDVMFDRSAAVGDLDDPEWNQPAVYALECALTALWGSVGVRPGAVAGHSLGELAASQAAGVFSLEDGMRFASARGALMAALPEAGAMTAIFATEEEVAEAVRAHNTTATSSGLSIAAQNGAHQVVSGPVADVAALSERLVARGVRVRPLNTSKAFHSALVEPALDSLGGILDGIEVAPPKLDLISNVTGGVVAPNQLLDGAYWRRQARQPVAFGRGVETLASLGADALIEIGPHGVLGPMAFLAWPESAGPAPSMLSSLVRPPRGETQPEAGFVDAVAQAYEAGAAISFEGMFAGEARSLVSLPSYPFQRQRHWIEPAERRGPSAPGHPLLGARHESPRGEVSFETELTPSRPEWLDDHRVYNRVIAPGAMYGAMSVSAQLLEVAGPAVLEDVQLHSPLIFAEDALENEVEEERRRVQLVLDPPDDRGARRVEVYSRAEGEEAWTMHMEGRVSSSTAADETGASIDPRRMGEGLSAQDVEAIYRVKADKGVELGASFQALQGAWSLAGESLAGVELPPAVQGSGLDIHPIMLDGCFQTVMAAFDPTGTESPATYLPFGWERLWLSQGLPERVICRARMRDTGAESERSEPAEVLKADLHIYDPSGAAIGGVRGFTMKRATRSALLSAMEGTDDLLYEVVWRNRPLSAGMQSADFLTSPAEVSDHVGRLPSYLLEKGVTAEAREALLSSLERLSQAYALEALHQLGWTREAGAVVAPEALRDQLRVPEGHRRLFHRMLEMLADAGVLTVKDRGFVVAIEDPEALQDPEALAVRLMREHPHGSKETGLLQRCGRALAEVLQGRTDPMELLFNEGDAGAADLYREAPASQASIRMLGGAIARAVSGLPEGRRLRVLEVGAGTGSSTAAVERILPAGQFDYTFTDISAAFFAEAEQRFGGSGTSFDFKKLDIETDPSAQGFAPNSFDLVIAANVVHATRDLGETLSHCRQLLAPSGLFFALENMRSWSWQDLTFGLLDGWWRFADAYRHQRPLAQPDVWRQALDDCGFAEVAIPDSGEHGEGPLGSGVIMARNGVEVAETPGVWVLAGGGPARPLAEALAARNQTVVLAGEGDGEGAGLSGEGQRVVHASVSISDRASWGALMAQIPQDIPFKGVVHLLALEGHGAGATTEELADDVTHAGASALALLQGLTDADAAPSHGVWFVTRGAQVLEREREGELAGAILWGFGKSLARETPHLQPRMIDTDPLGPPPAGGLVDELLHPDSENHIAYRGCTRWAARLVRYGAATPRIALPEGSEWQIAYDPGGDFGKLHAEPFTPAVLKPGEVRVAVEAAGVNFRDVIRAMGALDTGLLGRELGGRVVEVASDITEFAVGDRVAGLAWGTFSSEVVTRRELLWRAPSWMPMAVLGASPTAFVSAALSFDLSGLKAQERVLVHAGTGGVGMAAVQMAHALGAEVFATASAPKREHLRSMGVTHAFDSRRTAFGAEILEATGGEGVHVVVNSLTGPGFIEASLACLGTNGRFVELSRRNIWTEEEMAAARPDVAYSVLALDTLKDEDAALAGRALHGVMERLGAGELKPLPFTRWPMTEARHALEYMQAARHIGKIVLTPPPIANGRLRGDRTYLVTGGLGGIGCVVAEWLAEKGAGAIVLNGRRAPDAAAEEVIRTLKERGATVRVELADVTDEAAVGAMLERIDADLPPLGGVVHSVGVLSDHALGNQTWERFEQVLWPKVLGAWRLHRATLACDLDLFVLFSSVAGIVGNAGQGNHGAANAFLDQLAAHRRSLGLPGQAIAWGAWSGLGEAEEQRERIERHLVDLRANWLTPQQGIRAFERLVQQDPATSVVSSVDWAEYAARDEHPPPLFAELLAATASRRAKAPDATGSQASLLSLLRQTSATEQEETLRAFLQRELQAIMRMPSLPDPTIGFFDLGMDSLMAVELRNRLNRALAGQYTASNTVVFDYPTIADLAHHIAEALNSGESAEALPSKPAQRPPRPAAEDTDAIAIVGMACRFPGAPDLDAFWRLLESGGNTITEGRRGRGRWEGVMGDTAAEDPMCRLGSFVEGVNLFDAPFFRIPPIEARSMDPQQRMLLETSWQAVEDAGMDPERLRGTRTGVFVGIGGSGYRELAAATGGSIAYLGTLGNIGVGRVAFVLGLEGPAIPIDVACASSLVAVHQAVVSLQRGESDLALAGGVNVMLSTASTKAMAELGMLSPDGQCFSFDARANGFVRGEGCGMVVLKRLSDAEAGGDRVWGVVRGSAVNQNGVSAGITAPNGRAQERVIEEALSRAGVAPADVDYLEAYGVGSKFIDAIELQAAATAYGRGRAADSPLLVGCVKTNIGHLEMASGVSSLIKAVLAMKRGVIPRHLNLHTPNPEVDWDRLPMRVTTDSTEWPSTAGRQALAGVSAFSMSGTNAHVIVEGYGGQDDGGAASGGEGWPAGEAHPVDAVTTEPLLGLQLPGRAQSKRATRLLPLSARSEGALRALAQHYLDWLDDRFGRTEMGRDAMREALADMAWTAGVGRSHLLHRAGVVLRDTETLREGLRALVDGDRSPHSSEAGGVAFVYPGQGSGWAPLGRALYDTEPVAQAVLDRCDAVCQQARGASLVEAMSGQSADRDNHDYPAWEQPAQYALQCASTALWAGVGVRPSIVVGHQAGELAAAQAAGVLSLEDGMRLAVHRGTLQAGQGQPVVAGMGAALVDVALSRPSLPLVGSVAGGLLAPEEATDVTYWQRQARESVELEECVNALVGLDAGVVVEIGPAAGVGPIVARLNETDGAPGSSATDGAQEHAPVVVAGLSSPPDGGALDTGFSEAVAAAYEAGVPISFSGLFVGESRRKISVPSYPFQRRSYWVQSPRPV